jgi:protein AroM
MNDRRSANRTLGIAVIGQAPRDDIAALFAEQAPDGTKVILRGCLDGMSDAEIAAIAPVDGADTLYTRLPGDRDVKISKQAVISRASQTIAKLRDDGADALVFNCTGAFPSMPGDAGVLFPSRVLAGLSAGLLSTGIEVIAEALAPSASDADVEAAAARLKAQAPDLIAMDCMSYTPATKDIVRHVTGVPTLLGVTATARVLRELLE